MKILYSWLKDFIDLDLTPEELSKKLTDVGIEVASVETTGADFEGVFVAQIIKIEDHPNSDHLHLVTLDLGSGKTQRVVCGAPNVAVGQKVPLARVGARLGKNVLKPAVIRGVESEGMICSSDELGLTQTRARGIMVLDENLPLGTDVSSLYGKPDSLFDLEITSNRPDLLSHLGVARELGVLLNKPVKLPAVKAVKGEGKALEVEIQNAEGCPRYTGRIIRGVKNTQSPEWMKQRLAAMGLNPKNALVDVTNYVMFELGHPLHAFDLREVEGGKIIVRNAQEGEKFTLLGGRELTLNANCLMIADAHKATALAGIMGGLNSGIKDDTQDIFIEAAYFNPPTVNKTVKKFAVSSDSSQRFERGTDIEGVTLAMQRATDLFLELCGGSASEVVDVYPSRYESPTVVFTPAEINAILGAQIPEEKLKEIFGRLAAEFHADGEKWTFKAPTHRRDLNHKWDLAEEAARFAGYDMIPVSETKASLAFADNPKGIDLGKKYARALIGAGFCECKNIDFLGEKELKAFGVEPKNCIKIKNALAQGWDYLRPTLLPSLLKNVESNLRFGNRNLALFETTKTFQSIKGFPVEGYAVAGVLTGSLEQEKFFGGAEKPVDFYWLKGLLQALLADVEGVAFLPSKTAPVYMHPKICMDILLNGKVIGVFGKVHPLTLKAFDIKTQDVWAFEFATKLIEKAFSAQDFKPAKEVAVFPPSLRDLSVVLDESVSYASITSALDKTPLDVQLEYHLIDLYQGEHLPAGKKSVTFSLAFSNPQRTLKDKETDEAFNRIVQQLREQVGAELR
ncbi:phenylalanine--tRNA ligase subunit beta [Candidatus Avelusimicrobium gallicola]|uniref:Phenylalanine--tRNA ligase beta subunit n=1 Tax=Candidatus Avelusimicrobium gallicola TaxID=2562704 RepID=A0A1Y4DMQ8_9BACT|nr:phenylalanine--tRNA ligase subunit beta [Elusimicrobium sp. An273]OUO57600.1 phenylalanine--tRNA ligase subunit beta [Elusimicrobium sp. An273]